MALFLKRASLASMAAGFLVLLYSAAGSGAAAQEKSLSSVQLQPSLSVFDDQEKSDTLIPAQQAASLADLVAAEQEAKAADTSDDINCLAGAIYFEAGNEPLAGQLAVGRVIVARANSGRFPSSYCGVVYQPSQFSFVRGHAMPAINRDSRAWATAVRIAQIADDGLWKSPVEGAMFFHATHVSPRWGKTRMAKVDGHIFYR